MTRLGESTISTAQDYNSGSSAARAAHYFLSSSRLSWGSSRISRRNCFSSRVKWPCFKALRLPLGAPDPLPPCIRQRLAPATAGARHGVQRRVLAPQRAEAFIGPVLRTCPSAMLRLAPLSDAYGRRLRRIDRRRRYGDLMLELGRGHLAAPARGDGCGTMIHVTDDRLRTGSDVDMFDRDLMLALSAMLVVCLELGREPRLQLFSMFEVGVAQFERLALDHRTTETLHRRMVNRYHLTDQQSFERVAGGQVLQCFHGADDPGHSRRLVISVPPQGTR